MSQKSKQEVKLFIGFKGQTNLQFHHKSLTCEGFLFPPLCAFIKKVTLIKFFSQISKDKRFSFSKNETRAQHARRTAAAQTADGQILLLRREKAKHLGTMQPALAKV